MARYRFLLRRRQFSLNIGGWTDIFGKGYGRPGWDARGSTSMAIPRPMPDRTKASCRSLDLTIFNDPADNVVYNRGPIMNLIDSPSYPSGHTTYGYSREHSCLQSWCRIKYSADDHTWRRIRE